jgi:hypothetical protein
MLYICYIWAADAWVQSVRIKKSCHVMLPKFTHSSAIPKLLLQKTPCYSYQLLTCQYWGKFGHFYRLLMEWDITNIKINKYMKSKLISHQLFLKVQSVALLSCFNCRLIIYIHIHYIHNTPSTRQPQQSIIKLGRWDGSLLALSHLIGMMETTHTGTNCSNWEQIGKQHLYDYCQANYGFYCICASLHTWTYIYS